MEKYTIDYYREEIIDGVATCGDRIADDYIIIAGEETGFPREVHFDTLEQAQEYILVSLMRLAKQYSCTVVAEICDAPLHECGSWAIGAGECVEQLDTNWDGKCNDTAWMYPQAW